MRRKAGHFDVRDLVLVAPAYAWRTPPGVGAVVQLNSGGPDMTIVDIEGDMRTVAWRHDDGLVSEFDFSFRCLKPSETTPCA